MTHTLKRTLILAAALAPVVGMSVRPASAAIKFWDPSNGSGLGTGTATPTGTWDTVATNLSWNDTADGTGTPVPFVANDAAVFSAGSDATGAYTVTVSGTQAATSVLVEEGNITFASGVVNTGTGTFTIGTGAGSTARANIAASTTLNSAGKVVLDGGTLFNTNAGNAGSFISAAKGLEVTANGGTVGYDDGSATNAFTTIYTGTITGTGGTTANGGVGTLTKTGIDEFRYQAPAAGGTNTANTTFAKLVVNQGLYRLGSVVVASVQQTSELGFGAAPLAFTPDAITLNGGSIGASFAVTLNANRGITIGAAGGTINGTGGAMTIPGAITGAGLLNFNGSATLSSASNVTTFTGPVSILTGTVTLSESFNAANLTGAAGTFSVASGKTFTVGSDGTSTTFSGFIGGAGTFTKTGIGTLTTGANWSITGATNINQGTIKFGVGAAGLSTGLINITSAGTFDMNNIGDTFGPLTGSGPIINAANITTGATASSTYSGTITKGTVVANTFTKAGTGTFTFTGTSNHGGATTVTAGTLALANASGPALTGTSGVTLTTTLLLGASNQINDVANMSFNGGTFNTGGNSEGSFDGSNVGVAGLGVVSLAANSVLDFATGSSVVAFADSDAATFAGTAVLRVFNWTGTPLVGNGLDRLYVGSDATGLTATQLGQIQFFSDAGTTFLGTGGQLATGEVVAVPEPASIAVLGLGAAALIRRRRHA